MTKENKVWGHQVANDVNGLLEEEGVKLAGDVNGLPKRSQVHVQLH